MEKKERVRYEYKPPLELMLFAREQASKMYISLSDYLNLLIAKDKEEKEKKAA